jgi:ubiquitin-activating enzyme E1
MSLSYSFVFVLLFVCLLVCLLLITYISMQLPLHESLRNPVVMTTDFAKLDRQNVLHVFYQALLQYQVKHNRTLPAPHHAPAVEEIVAMVKEIAAAQQPSPLTLEESQLKLVERLAKVACGDLGPMAAFIGGVAAQEVLKACSGKFSPLQQWLYFDAEEALPSDQLPTEQFQLNGTRYDGQIAVFGHALQIKLSNLDYFLVGAGALGCEYLKNFAMMGLATNSGQVTVTDMDVIEKSNLSRQFLFRNSDIGVSYQLHTF